MKNNGRFLFQDNLLNCASILNDSEMRSIISDVDVCAREAQYRRSCRSKYQHRAEREESRKKQNNV